MQRLMFAIIVLIVCLNSCGTQNSNDEASKLADTSRPANSSVDTVAYDPAKDGMLVAPANTKKLGDTLGIKMYEVTVKPGDSVPVHSHPDHAFYVVQGGKAAIYFGNDRQEWDLTPGMGFVNGPVTDAAKNIGKTSIKFIVVDIYRKR